MRKFHNNKRKKFKYNRIFSFLIVIATIFMSIGYAAVNSVTLTIGGNATATPSEIYITEVNYKSNVDADAEASEIINAYQTILNSNIVLSSNNSNSSITYTITIYNSTEYAYYFEKVDYLISADTYSNENIVFELNGLKENDILNGKDSITFDITFYYNNNTLADVNNLKSLLNFKFKLASYVVSTYEYTRNYETFVAPHTGRYKIELWGAEGGGTDSYNAGKGAYTSGIISLNENDILYIYVGENGLTDQHTIFNNGGKSYDVGVNNWWGYSGGGATDVRISSGNWDDFNSLKDRIMVAAGGGGAVTYANPSAGGNAGGLIGYDGILLGTDGNVASGGTQTLGGLNGLGENLAGHDSERNYFGKINYSDWGRISTGGSGYYAGGNGAHGGGTVGSGAGGSSFISGHDGCDAIAGESTEDNIVHTGQNIHYSGYQFSDTVMIDGGGYSWTTQINSYVGMPTHDGTTTMVGNTGDGYAKITFLEEVNNNVSIEFADSEIEKISIEKNSYYQLSIPKKEGYAFTGWTVAKGNATIDDNILIVTTTDVSLQANWEYLNALEVYEFDFAEEKQEFIVPKTGYYQLEVWGAEGYSYSDDYHGGYGAYSTGKVYLEAGTNLYIYTGGKGIGGNEVTTYLGGFNGGGNASLDNNGKYTGSGGGATHIALNEGLLSQLANDVDKILIVAAGGGSSYVEQGTYAFIGGSGGGIQGSSGEQIHTDQFIGQNRGLAGGGTQTAGGGAGTMGIAGSFGAGGATQNLSVGGGAGFYGGGSGWATAAGGGSGYVGNANLIEKYMVAYNCIESTDESTKTISTASVNIIPVRDMAKRGNGYARILFLEASM